MLIGILGKRYCKNTPLPKFRLYADRAAKKVRGDIARNREAEPRALTERFYREEVVKNPILLILSDSTTIVLDAQLGW